MMKKLSIVVPVFNEQENIHEFYRRVTEVMAPLSYDYELLFIDDGSRDQSVDWNTPRGMPSSPWTATCSIRRK